MLMICIIGTSCQQDNLYDGTIDSSAIAAKFPVQNIDPNQTWKTVGTATARILVNKDYEKSYGIKIYSTNPLGDDSAQLLAKGSVVSGNTWTASFDYPLVDSVLYVTCIDNSSRRIVTPVKVTNGVVAVSFGVTATKSYTRSLTKADDVSYIPTENIPYTSDQINLFQGQATEVSSGTSLPQGGNTVYCITKDYNGIISYWGQDKQYTLLVKGTWTLSENQGVEKNLQIIVADGGKIIIPSGVTLQSNDPLANIIVMNGGEVSGAGGLTFTSGGSNYNGGIISVSSLNNNGGTFYNADGATLNVGILQQTATNSTFINWSKNCNINTTPISGSASNSVIKNGCKIAIADVLSVYNLYIGNTASVSCGSFYDEGGLISFQSNAILTVSGQSELGGNGLTINGPTAANAIFEMNSLKLDNRFSANNIYLEVSQYDKNDWTLKNSSYNNATLGNLGFDGLSLDSGDCSAGYNPKNKGDDHTDTNPFITTYAFEDSYPEAGDYDFNDLVLNMNKSISSNVVTMKVSIEAIGALKQLGAGIRLSGVKPSEISSISTDNGYSATWGDLMQQGSNGYLTSKDGYVVIPLFDNAHQALSGNPSRTYYNTKDNGATHSEKTLTITITANSSDVANKINSTNIDPFIIYLYNNSLTEVHTYAWKDNAAIGNVLKDNPDSKYVWALSVPSFSYPKEFKSIEKAYPKFTNWAQDRTTNTDWYELSNANSSYIYSK